ncbi:MAG: RIP metalloprotease RseP [Actinomycetota bacterium]
MQTETPAPPPSAPAPAEPETTNDFTGLIMMIVAVLALGFFASWSWAFFVMAIVFMIFMHELGHYLTARWTGMKVTEFFIGFGPKLWSFRKGETEYGVKGIPAGAYVRIIGMNNLDPVEEGDEPRSYRVKSWPRKMLVVSAGSLMHFLMAIVLFALFAFLYGVRADDGSWSVSAVSQASAAAELGIEPGDQILTVDGDDVTDFEQFGELVQARGGEPTLVTWERDGDVLSNTVTIGMRLTAEGADAFNGLLERDRILAIENTDVANWDDVLTVLAGREGDFVDMTVDPVGEPFPRVMIGVEVLDPTAVDDPTVGFFGVGREDARDDLGLFSSAWFGVTEFFSTLKLAGEGLIQFFTPGTLSNFVSDTLGGGSDLTTATEVSEQREINSRALDIRNPDEERILSIYGAARLGANADFQTQLGLLAVLNIFIGVFNMIPLPPLDGGHVAIGTYERIRSIGGRRHEVDYARVLPLTYAVFAFLVVVGVIALARDIIDPVDLG